MEQHTQKDLPFDRVLINPGSDGIEYSAEEFLELPLHQRVRHMLQDDMQFFRGGEVVDRKEALDRLRERTSA